MTPFRSENHTNWEGVFRVPALLRWPSRIPPHSICNDIVSHHDWLPTFLAAAGEPHIVEKLLHGHRVGAKKFKLHPDGYNLLPSLTGQDTGRRKGFFYFTDSGDLIALRYENWKLVFMEQPRADAIAPLRLPKLFNLRTDPFELADVTSSSYWDWYATKACTVMAAQALLAEFSATFEDYPPRHQAASFTIRQAMQRMESSLTTGR